MTGLALLAEQVGVSERTLRRAVNEGSLRAARPTPRTLDMPSSERRYVRNAWPLLATLRGALRTEANVRFALLFGSAATGLDTEASDLDIAVEMRDDGLGRVVDLATKLTAVTGRDVEIVRLADAERDPVLLADMIRDGRVLVDRERVWQELRGREPVLRRYSSEQDARRIEGALAGIDRLLAA